MSGIHDKALEVFQQMVAESKDGIWEGRLTQVVNARGYMSYYGRIVAILRNSGATEQIAKGAMGVPSRWKITDPSSTLDKQIDGRLKGGIVPKRDRLEARIEAIEKRLGGLDVGLAIGDMIQRMSMIEALLLKGGEHEANGDRPEAGGTTSSPLQVDG